MSREIKIEKSDELIAWENAVEKSNSNDTVTVFHTLFITDESS